MHALNITHKTLCVCVSFLIQCLIFFLSKTVDDLGELVHQHSTRPPGLTILARGRESREESAIML